MLPENWLKDSVPTPPAQSAPRGNQPRSWRILFVTLALSSMAFGQAFTEISTSLPDLSQSDVAWGDYDGDGDLDIAICGFTGSTTTSKIYRNNGGGSFTDIGASLQGVNRGSVDWGDYDNDGDLDLLLTGKTTGTVYYYTKIYRNNGADNFTEVTHSIDGVAQGAGIWGDYDNDGDLDFFITGFNDTTGVARIGRNNGNGTFTKVFPNIAGMTFSSADWGDFDNDGDLDLVVAGDSSGWDITRIYTNNAGNFTRHWSIPRGLSSGSVAWGDYDSDGDLDILIQGYDGGARHGEVVRNNTGSFAMYWTLPAAMDGDVAWGDFENDGDLDVLFTGNEYGIKLAKIFRNVGAGFIDTLVGLPGVDFSSAAWGDYDNDGKLDILLSGMDSSVTPVPITKLYHNNTASVNTAPSAPTSLWHNTSQNSVVLRWSKGWDNCAGQSGQLGLTYNLRVGVGTPPTISTMLP
ncbi:MAG: VCBS repeat-containing protein, partial [Candidatus Neomarinimicrobiota bacterium]